MGVASGINVDARHIVGLVADQIHFENVTEHIPHSNGDVTPLEFLDQELVDGLAKRADNPRTNFNKFLMEPFAAMGEEREQELSHGNPMGLRYTPRRLVVREATLDKVRRIHMIKIDPGGIENLFDKVGIKHTLFVVEVQDGVYCPFRDRRILSYEEHVRIAARERCEIELDIALKHMGVYLLLYTKIAVRWKAIMTPLLVPNHQNTAFTYDSEVPTYSSY